MNVINAFERCCRLCAEDQDVTILLFSAEAEALLLQNKLNKYLVIRVDENDELPKNVCIKCCSKLQQACEFIETAQKSQEILLDRISKLKKNMDKQDTEQKIEFDTIKCEYLNEESMINTMEINVDPMTILQNSDVLGSTNDENLKSNFESEDVTNMFSVDNADVSIKIIKRGDIVPSTLDENNDDKLDSNKPFHCITCTRRFCTELALKSHSWIHRNVETSPIWFTCNSCDARFGSKSQFLMHLKIHRTNGLCQLCGRVFRTEKNLALHMATHTVLNSFTCKICGRTYTSRSLLKNHSISHSNDRPYKCNVCDKGFKRRQDLKFHINQHTGAKPYKCPFCDKSFASSGNCYSHRTRMHPGWSIDEKVRTVSGGSYDNYTYCKTSVAKSNTNKKCFMKFHCSICDQAFMKRDNYTYHIYKHTGKKPFQCTFCSEEFVTRKGLHLHHDKEHPDKDCSLGLLSDNLLLK